MKSKIALLLLVQLLAWLTAPSAHAQGTAFTYQGRLTDPNGAANGRYDFTFAVFDTSSGGVTGSGTITNVAVAVSNGLFTTTLDFGNGPEGAPAWLEIGVRTNSGSGGGAFTTLAPRQQVLPTPYAMFATTASNLVGALPLAQLPAGVVTNGAGALNLSGTFTGNGASLFGVSASSLNGLTAAGFWQLNGNNVSPGQFLGSTNDRPLELRASNRRGLRLEADGANSVNVVGGWEQNTVAAGVLGATIGGGGGNYFGTDLTNRVDASFGTVAGGGGNVIRQFSYQGVIGGGYNNTIQSIATSATIGGGSQNTIQTYASSATISGGGNNVIQTNAYSATIGGGEQNIIRSDAAHATIGGGYVNVIQANNSYSAISGGYGNEILPGSESTTIGGGRGNVVSSNAPRATISGGYLNAIQSSAVASTIGGGDNNVIGSDSPSATIAGGFDNNIGMHSIYSALGGGYDNNIAAFSRYATIAGGTFNDIGRNSSYSAIGGGGGNNIAANSEYATIASGGDNNIGTNSGFSAIGGGGDHNIAANSSAATIAGGFQSVIGTDSRYSAIGGGLGNRIEANSESATIAGGSGNIIGTNSSFSAIGGGISGSIAANSQNATIAGGYENYIAPFSRYATVAGGNFNAIGMNSTNSAIGGGSHNVILDNSIYATIAGGRANHATNYAFAAGRRAKAISTGAFVWADSQDTNFSSTAANQFLVRAAGGVGINTSNPVVSLTVQGSGAYNAIGAAAIAVKNSSANKTWEWHVLDDGKMQFADLGAGATRMLIDTNGNVSALAFNPTSDRHAKENFAAVSAQEILAKVAALPITRWNFKQETGTPHIGPMAQDFHAAFGTGTDDRHIATVDADGVALAAIQGLNQKLEEQKAENAALKSRLEKLEQLMNLKAGAAR